VSFIVLFLTKVAGYFSLEQRFGLVQFTVGHAKFGFKQIKSTGGFGCSGKVET
jgi:hypothetical protein